MEVKNTKRWVIVIGNYEGLEKKAVNFLAGAISGHINYVLPVRRITDVDSNFLSEHNVIAIGLSSNNYILEESIEANLLEVPNKDESYGIYVGDSAYSDDAQMILIAGSDAQGLFYGCVDFYNKYYGDILCTDVNKRGEKDFVKLFDRKIPKWKFSASPAIKTRALWTWGHVIYDYRKFLENMALLRLNEVIIWNDIAPLNSRDVVEYAHSLGIKVIFGYAWGWGTRCHDVASIFDAENLKKIKEDAISIYENQYANSGCDGIYFQSFTEMSESDVNGKSIAHMVTELVNETAGEMLAKYPDLHIQFGLHATSVKDRLEVIKNTDKRIYIVWENCGAFPYTGGEGEMLKFSNTLTFTDKIIHLREENDKFGAVYKGILNLDWNIFEHFTEPYIMGEMTENFLKERKSEKDKMWKVIIGRWIKCLDDVIKVNSLIANGNTNAIVQALVEDSVFENGIMYPVALYAETLWSIDKTGGEICDIVSRYPLVKFPNL